MKKLIKQSVLAGGSFAGGVLAGYLISKNAAGLETVLQSAKKAGGRFSETVKAHQKRITEYGRVRVRAIQNLLNENFSDPIPNLYKATESMTFEDTDLKIPR